MRVCAEKEFLILAKSVWRVLLLGLMLETGAGALAQTAPAVTIDPAGEHVRVYLTPLDASSEAKFAKTFQVPEYGQYKSDSLVLQNTSGRAIVALTVVWTYTAGDRVLAFDMRTDSLSLSGAASSGFGSQVRMSLPMPGGQRIPVRAASGRVSADAPFVAAANEAMLVAPGFFVRESAASRYLGSPGGSVDAPADLQSASSISVSLDTVILDDGTVLGPDKYHTVDDITAGKAAIDTVVNAVRAAERSGQDPVAVLTQLANTRQTAANHGPAIVMQSMVARRLVRSPDWRKQIEKLEALQLPNFHR